MTIRYVENIYKEMKSDMVKLNKRELIEMYKVIFSEQPKSYYNKNRLVMSISHYFESSARVKLLKP